MLHNNNNVWMVEKACCVRLLLSFLLMKFEEQLWWWDRLWLEKRHVWEKMMVFMPCVRYSRSLSWICFPVPIISVGKGYTFYELSSPMNHLDFLVMLRMTFHNKLHDSNKWIHEIDLDGEYYNIDLFKKHLGMFYIDNWIELKST